MNYKPITIPLRATMLILPLGIIAWYSGNAFIFPSLGPTAYLMAVDWKSKLSPLEVIGGHICGVIGGSISYFWLVSPATMINLSGLQSGSRTSNCTRSRPCYLFNFSIDDCNEN